jgi:large subunit ribosomal protein L17
MRHKKNFNHLGRKSAHRKAMLSNMASSLIMHKRIQTTTAKAKALKSYVEPLITRSKDDSTHSRRVVFNYLQDKEAVSELFREVAPKVAERPGGYTRIIKLGARLGDSAEMCLIELVDYNENLLSEKVSEKKSTRRRRGGKKKSQPEAGPVPVKDIKQEQDVEEVPAVKESGSASQEDVSKGPETEKEFEEEPEAEKPVDEEMSVDGSVAEAESEEEEDGGTISYEVKDTEEESDGKEQKNT